MNDFERIRATADSESPVRALDLALILSREESCPIEWWHVHNLACLLLIAVDPRQAVLRWANDLEPLLTQPVERAA